MNSDNTVENPVIQVMDVVPSDNIPDYAVRQPKSKYSWIRSQKQ
jgi:hypothetical protein